MFLPVILFSAFFALKLFLWSLPLEQVTLFLIALPLGIAYFWGVFRCYGRSLTGRILQIRA
jgi:hypothetical protein